MPLFLDDSFLNFTSSIDPRKVAIESLLSGDLDLDAFQACILGNVSGYADARVGLDALSMRLFGPRSYDTVVAVLRAHRFYVERVSGDAAERFRLRQWRRIIPRALVAFLFMRGSKLPSSAAQRDHLLTMTLALVNSEPRRTERILAKNGIRLIPPELCSLRPKVALPGGDRARQSEYLRLVK